MPTRAGESTGLGGAAKLVADRARSIVRLEIELALAELKKKMQTMGVGVGLLVGAAIFGLFGLGFGLAAIAAGIATTLPWWAALLIVMAGVLLVAAVLALVGRSEIQKATPPVPEQALEEARLTTEALKNGGH